MIFRGAPPKGWLKPYKSWDKRTIYLINVPSICYILGNSLDIMKRSETSIWDIFGEYSSNQKFNKTSLECEWNVNWTFMEYWLIHLLWGCYHLTKIPCIWVNDHNSLTWIVGHLGMISRILTMILVRGNSEVVMKFTQMYPIHIPILSQYIRRPHQIWIDLASVYHGDASLPSCDHTSLGNSRTKYAFTLW